MIVTPIKSYRNTPVRQSPVANATVTGIEPDGAILELNGESVAAQTAFSCMIEPEPGDNVLCCQNQDGMYFILAIIERKMRKRTVVSIPGENAVFSAGGNLHIHSEKTVSVRAKAFNCFSNSTVHKSREAVISFENVKAAGNVLEACYKTVNLFGNLISSMAGQVIQRFKGYIRTTENDDQVKAGHLSRKAEGLFSLDSEYCVMVSKKDTKIDGERIHMG